MKILFKSTMILMFVILNIFYSLPVPAQTRTSEDTELPSIKVAFSDDHSIIVERVLAAALWRSGYQMIAKATGMRTAVADVNYGDAVILPSQTDGWDRIYPNLIKVPIALDNVEFTVYTRAQNNYQFSAWSDMSGLRLGYRWQNEYVANNIRRANPGELVTVNEVEELWDSLLNNQTDAIILPRMSHFEYRYPQGIKKAGVIERQPVYTYVNSRHAYLVPLLEEAYRDIIADGTMQLIHSGRMLSNKIPIILHINSYNTQNEWERMQMESIRSNIESKTSLQYYSINLNANELHSQANYNAIVSEIIRTEFIMRHPDLIIASGNEAFEYVLDNYHLLFTNMPILFFGVYGLNESVLYGLEENITGIFENISFHETAAEMLLLYPNIRRIFILNDYSCSRSLDLRNEIEKSISSSNLSVEFFFNDNKPLPEILTDISGFGPDTLVLIGNFIADSSGAFYSEKDLQRLVTEASIGPVFCLLNSYIGNGTLGGLVTSSDARNNTVASMAADILKGIPPAELPIISDSAVHNQWQFDYEPAKKYNINTKTLPAGHLLINRKPLIWESNPLEFTLMIIVALLLLMVICGLFIFFNRNKKMTERLSRQKELLEAVNKMSAVLLEPDLENIGIILLKAMVIIEKAMDVDRIAIWKNHTTDEQLCSSLIFKWPNNDSDSTENVLGIRWQNILTQGGCINSVVSDLPPDEQEMLKQTGVVSVFIAPVLMNNVFWGYVGFYDCHNGRFFTENEEKIVRSVALMIANAFIRKEMTQNLHNTARQLEIAAKNADNANKAKSSFLANMSHEIRTPMNAILGIAEIQLRSETILHETGEAFEKIYESGDLLLNIINDILDLSKIEAGKLELVPFKYDIPSLINDSAQINRLRYDSKPIEFFINVDENTPLYLFGDELRIKQVLNNILSNAFKYTNEGTVSLNVFTEPQENEDKKEEGREEEVILVFRVRDTGQGMTEEQVANLFEEYTRFNLEANRETVGTGLGMSITRHLLELMNGEISVASEPGSGSQFTVRIPQIRVGSEVCGSNITRNLRNFNFRSSTLVNKTQFLLEYMPYGSVLVVDDVESNIYVTRGMMLPYGISIDTASSGFEAIEKIKDGNVYDIIFMDHMMPRMDGIEATKKIREMGYTNTIVALTANALVGRAEMFLKNGFDGFISKPIDSRELNRMLIELIRNKQPQEVIEAARRETINKNSADKDPSRLPDAQETTHPETTASVNSELLMAAVNDIENAIDVLEELLSTINTSGIANNESDLILFTTTVHGMKSALANVGEMSLSKVALRLEEAADREERTLISAVTPEFIKELRFFMGKVKQQAQPAGAGTDENMNLSPEDKGFLINKLNDIKTACEKLILNDAKTVLKELKRKTWPGKISEIINEISMYLLRGECARVVSAAEKAIDVYSEER